ncbi:Retrotransposon gag domain protein [Actinidia chinensis var. chinensis]|uniref:Retrotransposon gag domain protein n=1 Tax=Actinidia chinensis var. chinensis TaxID=1590841 RepID=A0A2R6QHG8_ACTCC|nr:Retrotransposon gag domain protein [Actinidia chinensis var. chinensis]
MVCSPSFTLQQFGVVCGNDSSQLSMHLRSRLLPKPSASSPLDNRAHPIANTSQISDQERLHREIHGMAEQMRVINENNARLVQLLAAANPPPPAAPPIPDIERSHHSHCSGDDHSRNYSTGRGRRGRHRSSSPPRRENSPSSESRSSNKTPEMEGKEARRGRSPRKNRAAVHEESIENQSSSRFKLPTQLETYEGKTDHMDHLDSYKSLMSLHGCSDEVMCKAFSATLKGSARSWFRKLPPGTIDSFGDLSRLFVANFMSCKIRQKNASHLFTVHQKETKGLKDYMKWFNHAVLEVEDPSDKVSKADKYIAAEELAETKRRRRGKDDHKRKEPDARRPNYKDEVRSKRPNRDSKRTNKRRPRTPPRCPELILPPLNAPIAQIADLVKKECLRKYVINRLPPNSPKKRYGDNRPITGDIQMIHGGFGSDGCSNSSRKRHARSAHGQAKEEIYNLSSPVVNAHPPITNNDDLRGNMTHPLGWIKLPVTLGTEPHQITAWQDFIVVDCPSPYNAILGRSTLGGTRAITSTYHLKMKFSTSTRVGEVRGDQKVAKKCFISAMKVETSAPSAQ